MRNSSGRVAVIEDWYMYFTKLLLKNIFNVVI